MKLALTTLLLTLALTLATACGNNNEPEIPAYTADTQQQTQPTEPATTTTPTEPIETTQAATGTTFTGRFRAEMDDTYIDGDFDAYLDFSDDGTFDLLMTGDMPELGLDIPLSLTINGRYQVTGNELELIITPADITDFVGRLTDDLLHVLIGAILAEELGDEFGDLSDDDEFMAGMSMMMDAIVRQMLAEMGEELAAEFSDLWLNISNDFNRLYNDDQNLEFVRV